MGRCCMDSWSDTGWCWWWCCRRSSSCWSRPCSYSPTQHNFCTDSHNPRTHSTGLCILYCTHSRSSSPNCSDIRLHIGCSSQSCSLRSAETTSCTLCIHTLKMNPPIIGCLPTLPHSYSRMMNLEERLWLHKLSRLKLKRK